MRRKWLFLSVAAVLAGTGAVSLYRKTRAPSPAPKTVAAPAPTGSEVTLSGQLRPQHVVPVNADVDGEIDALLVNVGDEVFEGEPLARIGSAGLESQREVATAAATAAEAQVARAETAVGNARLEASRAEAEQQRSRAAMDKARAVYDHQQLLNREGATPRLAWQSAQRDYQNAQQEYGVVDLAARLAAEQVQSALNALAAARKDLVDRQQEVEAAQVNMQAAEVRSPVQGIVVARSGEAGKPAGAELFDVATDMFALEVALDAEPKVLRRLHPGESALVAITDLQNAWVPGAITEIRETQVVVQFNCTLPAVRPGMRVDVRLKLE